MTPLSLWVIGRGGMLGSALERKASNQLQPTHVIRPTSPIEWHNTLSVEQAWKDTVRHLAASVQTHGGQWLICWAAGAGVIGTSADQLRREEEYFASLLAAISLEPSLLHAKGCVFLASSAGAVYGDSPDSVLTEESASHPLSQYGKTKLAQEDLLTQWQEKNPGNSTLIGRISNLYGPGQNVQKPQGIISHISRSLLFHMPVHIFVPLDTTRDYLHVDECSSAILTCLRFILSKPPSRYIKLFCSERPTTVAQIVSIFNRISRQPLRIITSANTLSAQHRHSMRFMSVVLPAIRTENPLTLPEGIAQLHDHQRLQYAKGQLLRPAIV